VNARPPIVIRDGGEGFTLDAAALAQIFGWTPEELRERMHRGLVTSLVERGEGSDRGKWRLSVQCGNRRWQAIIGQDGTIAEQHTGFLTRNSRPCG
jgi:hypothetical protein